jgi:hypothetical protein
MGRRGWTLRTRRHIQWTDNRTRKLVGRTQCCDAKPRVDTDQDQHSSRGGQQRYLAHLNASQHSARHASRGECSLDCCLALVCSQRHSEFGANVAKLPEGLTLEACSGQRSSQNKRKCNTKAPKARRPKYCAHCADYNNEQGVPHGKALLLAYVAGRRCSQVARNKAAQVAPL